MQRIGRTRYTTGAFAKLFGINKDTLLYYDKINLFKPAIVGENGYRYYDASQIEVFWVLYSLREMGVSIKELSSYTENPTPEQLFQLMAEQEVKVAEEIKRLQKLQHSLHYVKEQTLEGLHAKIEEFNFIELQDQPIVYSEFLGDEAVTSNTYWGEAYTKFVKDAQMSGVVYTGSVLAEADVKANDFTRIHRLYRITTEVTSTVRPGGLYAITYVKGSYETLIDSYPYLIQKLESMGYEVNGDIFEEYTIGQVATKQVEQYVTKLYIPVKRSIEYSV
ncbi:MerR family transcriptional regulator [uncultured Veillonella sp.]|uniref:MerR family transcriptional regulator n=1 Tax=uncultured Veillonella sp. TaxID=159268 RepID=UPI0025DCDDDA|nr:MerR family transcriptional regulator [uncultured Veillonella sp.]MDY3974831.1 MerR family transcriptional regulator [Veillonella caviae]